MQQLMSIISKNLFTAGMDDNPDNLVPIRTVCAMYNLNPNTLRTWERRYGIIEPKRSDGGHRAFGPEDLGHIEQMLDLLNDGLTPAEAAERVKRPSRGKSVAAPTRSATLRKKFHTCVDAMDNAGAMAACRAAIETLGYEPAVEHVLFPELAYWGHRWERGDGNTIVAQEHMATLAVKAVLMERQQALITGAKGPSVTLACAPGEAHDLAIIHVSNLLVDSGVGRPVLFVAGLPLEEVLEASRRLNSQAIVLSATIIPRSAVVKGWLDAVVLAGWEERTVLVGPGFSRSRIYSRMKVKAAPGGYQQVIHLLRRMLSEPAAA